MKLVEDNSAYSYGVGTNPQGGGTIWVQPETAEDEKLLQEMGLLARGEARLRHVYCRKTRRAPNPHDDGLNPCFVDLVRQYGWRTKGYPEL